MTPRRLLPLLCAGLLLAPALAGAQTLVVEPVRNPFVVAPDYKVTHVNGDTGQLAGGYAGRLFDDTLFVGGGGYWLVNGSGGDALRYGGVLVGWSAPLGGRIRFGVRGLAGVGQATLGQDVTTGLTPAGGRAGMRDPRVIRFGGAPFGGRGGSTPGTLRLRFREDFFVFEPQASVATRLTRHLGLQWGAGYRLTSADRLGEAVNGATGSVALELAW